MESSSSYAAIEILEGKKTNSNQNKALSPVSLKPLISA